MLDDIGGAIIKRMSDGAQWHRFDAESLSQPKPKWNLVLRPNNRL